MRREEQKKSEVKNTPTLFIVQALLELAQTLHSAPCRLQTDMPPPRRAQQSIRIASTNHVHYQALSTIRKTQSFSERAQSARERSTQDW
jgi:hypothetical protein